jgi:cell wall-associated NlpC family hydrolase
MKFFRATLLAAVVLGFQAAAPCQTTEPKPEQGVVASLLTKAKDYLGTPYRYGGSTPNGFDCSGFVRFVFSSFGINLNRSSVAQATQGDSVSLDQIQPGDLLFFKTRGQKGPVSHVGIYLGGGEFIHAGAWGGPSQRAVKIGQLDSTYYAQRLVSARRLLLAPTETPQLLDQLIQPTPPSLDKEKQAQQ